MPESSPQPSAGVTSARPSAFIAKAARCRADALHKFSRKVVDRYQHIVVGDVSALKLVKTRMAQSVLDSGWGMLKRLLAYKSEHAARGFEVTSERYTSVTCSACGSRSGPRGVNGLIVRSWVCRDCGESHDREVNAARNILIGSRCRTSVCSGMDAPTLSDGIDVPKWKCQSNHLREGERPQ